ncbi:unnamed protein product [Ilex paraguariensis]|uniref:Protein kinase domain-containing protein n=1 Tax=Ilex paraguariensis TaxID=185542 RepID=A0ABC8RLD0_9AQUA
MHNFSTVRTPFRYGPYTTDLFFFYNCTLPYDKETYEVDCASTSSHHSFAIFHTELLKHWNYSAESCQSLVNVVVEADDLNRLLEMNFTGILKKGFVLQWDALACSKCQSSGGSCGSYNYEFVCFCDDHLHHRTCKDALSAATVSALVIFLIFFFYHRRHRKCYAASSFISQDVSSYPTSVTDLEKAAKSGLPTWTTRMSIAIETASVLAYLHASDVIHRDVKTNNILLDNNFSVKVADFGLSRLFPTDVSHVSTAPQGTPGYVDPEYHQCYQLTDKSDVYSFGVVLIELISSKPSLDITRHRHEITLSNMAINKIQKNALHELVDPSLGFESDCKVRELITDIAELAFQCLKNGRGMRPSMKEVLEVLKEIQSKDYGIQKTEGGGISSR